MVNIVHIVSFAVKLRSEMTCPFLTCSNETYPQYQPAKFRSQQEKLYTPVPDCPVTPVVAMPPGVGPNDGDKHKDHDVLPGGEFDTTLTQSLLFTFHPASDGKPFDSKPGFGTRFPLMFGDIVLLHEVRKNDIVARSVTMIKNPVSFIPTSVSP